MSANLQQIMVQWQPPTMLEALFTQLDVGHKFAAHHDAISDKNNPPDGDQKHSKVWDVGYRALRLGTPEHTIFLG